MRLFIAHRLDAAPAMRVATMVSSMRARLPKAAWVNAHAYHLTFAFLGEQGPDVVPGLVAAIESAAAPVAAFDASLARCGFFPNEQRPRVGWIAVEPHESVEAIANAVREAVAACGLSFDAKQFRAHLTLVRIRDGWRPHDASLFLRTVDGERGISFRLDRIALYESRLRSSGAVHEEIAGFALE